LQFLGAIVPGENRGRGGRIWKNTADLFEFSTLLTGFSTGWGKSAFHKSVLFGLHNEKAATFFLLQLFLYKHFDSPQFQVAKISS